MMPEIPMKIQSASTSMNILDQYQKIQLPVQKDSFMHPTAAPVSPPSRQNPAVPVVPPGGTILRRGEKFAIAEADHLRLIFRWNVCDSRCDLDASAFLLGQQGKVIEESWFVFYGQTSSPDHSTIYSGNTGSGAELQIHLTRVSPQIQKIALAVTIYEALAQKLHFGMVQNLSVSLVNANTGKSLATFALDDCSSAVTAMVVGELYRYKDTWKFNAVGSGVARDLAGFCAMYGIETG